MHARCRAHASWSAGSAGRTGCAARSPSPSAATAPSAPRPARCSTPATARWSIERRARTRDGCWCSFAGVDDRTAAERLLGAELTADPLRRATRSSTTTSSGCTRWSAPRCTTAAGAVLGRVDRGRGEPRARPPRARRRRAGADGVRGRAPRRRGRGRPARRTARPLSERAGAVRVDVFTIFPEWFAGPLDASLLGKARAEGRLDVRVHDLREHTTDRHRSVDDTPFGGGAGMVMAPEPIFAAVEAADPPRPLLLLSAAGRRFDQAYAAELASRRRVLVAVRPVRGRRPAGGRPSSATARCRSATTCSPAARPRPRS